MALPIIPAGALNFHSAWKHQQRNPVLRVLQAPPRPGLLMETGCCPSSFHRHRSRGHGCLWGADESFRLPPQRRQKGKEERRVRIRGEGFPGLQVKDPGIYMAARGRMGLKKKKEAQTRKRESTDRQLTHGEFKEL